MSEDMTPFTDIDGNIITVGDIIVRPVYSILAKHQVLDITENNIKVSVFRRVAYKSYIADYHNDNSKNVVNHNSEVYIQRDGKFPQVLLIEKADLTPEDINRYKQIKTNESKKSSKSS